MNKIMDDEPPYSHRFFKGALAVDQTNVMAIKIAERFVLIHGRHAALLPKVLAVYRKMLLEELRAVNAEIQSRKENPEADPQARSFGSR